LSRLPERETEIVEGIGSDPGTLEVIDLDLLKTVATADLPPQAAGVDFWKTEPSKLQ